MEQRKPRGRSRSRSRGTNSETAVKTVTVVEEQNGAKPKRGRSRSRSKSRGRGKGILKQSANPVSAAIATNLTRRRRSRSRGRGKKPGKGGEAHLQREITNLKKKTNGPKVSDSFKLTATLGVVAGNTASDFGIQRSLSINLHPLLLRDATANNASTPLSDRAKNYALWRCTGCHLRFMPFVNDSHVTGTLIISSLDLDSQASKPLSIDALLARPYCEMGLGARGQWTIPQKTLRGPEEGWWKVDTNDTATNCIGPGIDIHTYGTTYNLLSVPNTKDKQTIGVADLPKYTGPLCSVQITLSFQFANWEPKPALGTLVSETVPSEGATISTDDEQNLVITPNDTPGWQRFNEIAAACDHHISPHYHFSGLKAVAPTKGLGSTIWSITDTVADAAGQVLPGPWGWLVKNGYSFLRRIFNPSGTNALPSYKMYASFEDAQKDIGCTNDAPINTPVNIPMEEVRLNQMNNTNVQNPGGFAPTTYTPGPTPGQGEYPLPVLAPQTSPWAPGTYSDWITNGNGFLELSLLNQRVLTSPTSAQRYLQAWFMTEDPFSGQPRSILMSGMSDYDQQHAFPPTLPRPVFDVVRVANLNNVDNTASNSVLMSGPGLINGDPNLAHYQPRGTIYSLMKYAFGQPKVNNSYPPFLKLRRDVRNQGVLVPAMFAYAQNNDTEPRLLEERDLLRQWYWNEGEDLYVLPGLIPASWQYKATETDINYQPALLLVSKTTFDATGNTAILLFSSLYPHLKWGDAAGTYDLSFSYPVNPFSSAAQFSDRNTYGQLYGRSSPLMFYITNRFLNDVIPSPPQAEDYPPYAAKGANSRYVADLERRLAEAQWKLAAQCLPLDSSPPHDSDEEIDGFEPIERPSEGACGPGGVSPDEEHCPSLDEQMLEQLRKLMVKSKK
nr:MAG: capsid protein [Astroviridae sp.]